MRVPREMMTTVGNQLFFFHQGVVIWCHECYWCFTGTKVWMTNHVFWTKTLHIHIFHTDKSMMCFFYCRDPECLLNCCLIRFQHPKTNEWTNQSPQRSQRTDQATSIDDHRWSEFLAPQMFSDPEEYEKWKARGWRARWPSGPQLGTIQAAERSPRKFPKRGLTSINDRCIYKVYKHLELWGAGVLSNHDHVGIVGCTWV